MIRGFVETARVFQVRGWVFDEASPALKLDVEALLDGRVIGRTHADIPREDLRAAGIGDGAHGFVLETDTPVPVDSPERLIVQALAGGEVARVPFGDDFRAVPNVVDAGIRGFVGALGADAVAGWAWNPAAAGTHLAVELRLNRQAVASTRADQFRPDLARAGIGAGDHGFILRPRHSLNAAELQRLEVAVVLPGGARQFLPVSIKTAARSNAGGRAPAPDLALHDPAHRPVFVLGPVRSGTSALAQGLLACTRYRGHHEGHLLDIADTLHRAIDRFYEERSQERLAAGDTLIADVPPPFFKTGVLALLVSWARVYYPDGLWLDKSPRAEATLAAPLYLAAWPRARFLFARREARANVASQRRKFPWKSFEAICRTWADGQRAWLAVRDRLGPAAIEVPQAELATAPDAVAARLAGFLELTGAEQAGLARAFAHDWPEQTLPRVQAARAGSGADWTAAEEEMFQSLCAIPES